MSLPALPSGLAPPAVTPAQPPAPVDRGAFDAHLEQALGNEGTEPRPAAGRAAEMPAATPAGPARTPEVPAPDAASEAASPRARLQEALGAVAAHQRRLDAVIEQARSGRTFSPQELLALQARTHRFAHDLNLVSKVVEQLSAGMKKTLDTQL